MVALAFMAQSLAVGPTYGAFGPLLMEFERSFGMSRATVSLALSLVVLASGLLAPVTGWLVGRFTIRRTLMLGAVLLTIGYSALIFATSGTAMLLIYALLIGPGVALLGWLPNATLVTNWYAEKQGRMLGIVNMPLAVMAMPLIVVTLLPHIGLKGVLVAMAAVHAIALPFLLMVVDRPEDIGQRPYGENVVAAAGDLDAAPGLPMMRLLVMPAFLLIIIGAGLAVGAGVSKTVHLVPLLTERGWDLERAALLLSISGGTGVIGSLLFGWMADRWGGGSALIFNCVVQGVVWMILILPVGFGVLVLDAVIIGMCGGGFLAAKAVLVNQIFGRRSFAAAMGLSGLLTVPFLFGMAPLAGWLRDVTGDYMLAVSTHIAGFGIAALCFTAAALMARRGRVSAATTSVAEAA